jgi:hypothetical protein
VTSKENVKFESSKNELFVFTNLSSKQKMFDVVFGFILSRLEMFEPSAIFRRVQETANAGRRNQDLKITNIKMKLMFSKNGEWRKEITIILQMNEECSECTFL